MCKCASCITCFAGFPDSVCVLPANQSKVGGVQMFRSLTSRCSWRSNFCETLIIRFICANFVLDDMRRNTSGSWQPVRKDPKWYIQLKRIVWNRKPSQAYSKEHSDSNINNSCNSKTQHMRQVCHKCLYKNSVIVVNLAWRQSAASSNTREMCQFLTFSYTKSVYLDV